MGHPVTTNPFIIMLINMTVVFVVLYGLSLLIRLIHIIDPTKSAVEKPAAVPASALTAAPAVAPAADNSAVLAVIAAAVAACGCSEADIVTIRPVGSPVWTNAGRMAGIQNSVN